MYAVKPNGAVRVYVPDTPLDDDETLYDELPQFVLDYVARQFLGE